MAIDNEDLRNAMTQMSGRQPWPHQLGAIEAMRAARPVGSPVAGGTPTQRRREAEESARQFEEQMKLQREQMALQEKLARMARAAASRQQQLQVDPRVLEGQSIQDLVSEALKKGKKGLDYIHEQITGHYWKFQDPQAALAAAEQMFRAHAYDPYGTPQQIQRSSEDLSPLNITGGMQDFMRTGVPRAYQTPDSVMQQAAQYYPAFAPREDYMNQYASIIPQSPYTDKDTTPQLFAEPPTPRIPIDPVKEQANLWAPSTWGNINPGFGSRWKK